MMVTVRIAKLSISIYKLLFKPAIDINVTTLLLDHVMHLRFSIGSSLPTQLYEQFISQLLPLPCPGHDL